MQSSRTFAPCLAARSDSDPVQRDSNLGTSISGHGLDSIEIGITSMFSGSMAELLVGQSGWRGAQRPNG